MRESRSPPSLQGEALADNSGGASLSFERGVIDVLYVNYVHYVIIVPDVFIVPDVPLVLDVPLVIVVLDVFLFPIVFLVILNSAKPL